MAHGLGGGGGGPADTCQLIIVWLLAVCSYCVGVELRRSFFCIGNVGCCRQLLPCFSPITRERERDSFIGWYIFLPVVVPCQQQFFFCRLLYVK